MYDLLLSRSLAAHLRTDGVMKSCSVSTRLGRLLVRRTCLENETDSLLCTRLGGDKALWSKVRNAGWEPSFISQIEAVNEDDPSVAEIDCIFDSESVGENLHRYSSWTVRLTSCSITCLMIPYVEILNFFTQYIM